MAHGMPDDSNIVYQDALYRADDLGELAIRLGAPGAFLRSGHVVWQDNFGEGVGGWSKEVVGVGSYALLANTWPVTGGVCMVLYADDTDPGLIQIDHTMGVPYIGRYGLACMFVPDETTYRVEFELEVNHGPVNTQYSIRYDHSAHTLSYVTTGPAWVVFAVGVSISDTHHVPYIWKLVLDSKTQMYDHLFFAGVKYDLSGILGFATVVEATWMCRATFMTRADGADPSICWLDDVILTIDEP